MIMEKLIPQRNASTCLVRQLAGGMLIALLAIIMACTCAIPVFGQQRTIRGKITTAAGEVVPGASVRIKGTSTGTTSNADGMYSLAANKGRRVHYHYNGL
jgi:hypothetical protein